MIGLEDGGEMIEKMAWADLLEAGEAPGTRLVRVGQAVALVCPAIDGVLLNRAFGVTETTLAPILDAYREAGVERFFIHEARGASGFLAASTLTRYPRSWIKLARPGRIAPGAHGPHPFTIAPATPADGVPLGRIFAEAFDAPGAGPLFARAVGRPRWHAWVAREGDEVIGGGLLFASDSVACLVAGATAPEHRRRGVQTALITERIRRSVELGCRVIFSETGERVEGEPSSSYDNMLRLGFRPIYRRHNWAPAGTTWSRSVA